MCGMWVGSRKACLMGASSKVLVLMPSTIGNWEITHHRVMLKRGLGWLSHISTVGNIIDVWYFLRPRRHGHMS